MYLVSRSITHWAFLLFLFFQSFEITSLIWGRWFPKWVLPLELGENLVLCEFRQRGNSYNGKFRHYVFQTKHSEGFWQGVGGRVTQHWICSEGCGEGKQYSQLQLLQNYQQISPQLWTSFQLWLHCSQHRERQLLYAHHLHKQSFQRC